MTTKSKQEELHDKIKHNILVPFATYQDPMHRAQLLFEQGAVTGDDYGYGITVERIENLINSEILAVLEELEKEVRSPISLIGSEKFKGGVVPLSAIQTIKERYGA